MSSSMIDVMHCCVEVLDELVDVMSVGIPVAVEAEVVVATGGTVAPTQQHALAMLLGDMVS